METVSVTRVKVPAPARPIAERLHRSNQIAVTTPMTIVTASLIVTTPIALPKMSVPKHVCGLTGRKAVRDVPTVWTMTVTA